MTRTNKCLLALHDISHSFAGMMVIDGFSMMVQEGEIVVLLAPSGAGKSTLLRIALAALMPDNGDVQLNISGSEVSLVTQEDPVLPWLTVRENVSFTVKLLQKCDDLKDADDLLRRYNLIKFANHYPSEISGGMIQLVAICRALHHKGKLLVLDEGVAHIDEVYKSSLIGDVRCRVREKGLGAFVVTQNPSEALLLADRILIANKRPLSLIKEKFNDLPFDREPDIVHSDVFGNELRELRQCLHNLWT